MEECHELLKESVDTSPFPYFSSKQVAGRVSEKFISIRKKIRYRNSFQTVMLASLKAGVKGTEITATIGLHPFVKPFMFMWFGGVIVIGGIILVISLLSLITGKPASGMGVLGVLIPLAIAIGGTGLLKFGIYLARGEAEFLKAFLIDLLDADEIKHVGQEAAKEPMAPRGL